MKAGVDFYYDQGFLINFYGHGDNSEYSSYVITKPAIWSANSVSLYDWWSQRSTVNISPVYNLIGNSVNLVTTVSNATDPQTAIEIVIPNWNTNAVNNFQVIFDGEIANQEDYRITKYGVKIKVGNTVNTVEVNYDIPEIPPTLTPTPIGSGPITLGESSILGTDDYGNANLLIAQQADLGQNGTIQSLSFYVSSTSGQLRLGIYTDAGGNPGNLIAQTPAFTPVAGWNTKDIITPVTLSAGRYWLAYLPQSNSLHYRVELTGNARGYSYSFGSLPSTFSSSAMSADVHWSLYATLLPETVFTPTPSITVLPTSTLTFTPTITKTATPSSTPTSLPTYTPTNTYTFIPTITNSSTPSSTPTPTLTLTSSPTNTITPSLVPSATFTQTSTATRTPTNTITSTFIPPTNTSIATLTSTYTGTATNTRTPSLLPTSTFTRTPTNTPVPSNTPSPTRTMTFTPTFTATSINTGPVLIGETDIVGIDDYGNANLLIAQQADLGQSGTIQSLSFYVTSTSGQLRLGIYADAGGRPGILLAQTAAFTPVIGWNTRNVITPVFMPAGSYWLAYLPQSNSLHYRVELTGTARGYSYSFGALPNSFSSSPMSADVHWSFYATIQ